MSSLSIIGMFSLANGPCEQISSQMKSTTYIVYDSSISCPDNMGVDNIQIRHFSPNVLPNDIVALIIEKVAFPSSSPTSTSQHTLLLTMQFFSFPGDVSSEKYDTSLPNFLHPIIFGIGHISSVGHSTESPRTFTISTSLYISGTSIPLSIRCDLQLPFYITSFSSNNVADAFLKTLSDGWPLPPSSCPSCHAFSLSEVCCLFLPSGNSLRLWSQLAMHLSLRRKENSMPTIPLQRNQISPPLPHRQSFHK